MNEYIIFYKTCNQLGGYSNVLYGADAEFIDEMLIDKDVDFSDSLDDAKFNNSLKVEVLSFQGVVFRKYIINDQLYKIIYPINRRSINHTVSEILESEEFY